MLYCCPPGPVEIELNAEFEAPKISEFVDISNWVHHVPYILPQVTGIITVDSCKQQTLTPSSPSILGSYKMVEPSTEGRG